MSNGDVVREEGEVERQREGGEVERQREGGEVERQREGGEVERQREGGEVERQREGGEVERQREGGEVERQREGRGGDEVFSEAAVVLSRRHHSIMRASGECSHAWRYNSWTAKCTFTKPSTLTTHPPVSPTIPLSPSPLQVWLSQTIAQHRG